MAETSEDEKSWSDQVEEYEEEKSAFLPSSLVPRSPPPKRNAALSNLHAPMPPKRNADMLARPKPTVARHHMSEPTKSLFRTLSPSPEASHHASEPTKSSLNAQSPPPGEPNSIVIALQAIRDKLSKQHTSGAPLLVRNAVLKDIENLITDVTNEE